MGTKLSETIAHHFGGGTYAKETLITAGETLSQHSHPHEHLSILASGLAVVSCEGVTRRLRGPACITIPAHKRHAVTAVTDVIWYCIWATDVTDVTLVDAAILAA